MHRANFGQDAAPAARPPVILARLKISKPILRLIRWIERERERGREVSRERKSNQ